MSLIAYFWCLLGLYLGVFINLNPGCGSCYMNEETVYTFSPLLRLPADGHVGKIAALRSDLREITTKIKFPLYISQITILNYFILIMLFISDLRFD